MSRNVAKVSALIMSAGSPNLKILAASIQILNVELGLVAPTCNLSTLEAKAGGVM